MIDPDALTPCNPSCPWDHTHLTEIAVEAYRNSFSDSPSCCLSEVLGDQDAWEDMFNDVTERVSDAHIAGLSTADALRMRLMGMPAAHIGHHLTHYPHACHVWLGLVVPLVRSMLGATHTTLEQREKLTDAVGWADLEMTKVLAPPC